MNGVTAEYYAMQWPEPVPFQLLQRLLPHLSLTELQLKLVEAGPLYLHLQVSDPFRQRLATTYSSPNMGSGLRLVKLKESEVLPGFYEPASKIAGICLFYALPPHIDHT